LQSTLAWEASNIETSSRICALQTLTSGTKREIHGGALQAHICVVSSENDIGEVMTAFREADGFCTVASWTYACRCAPAAGSDSVYEVVEDGLDEGCGDKMLGVLRRCDLTGLLLVVSRWQDYGASSGIDALGTELYSQVVESCKDLIANLKQAVGMNKDMRRNPDGISAVHRPPPGPKNFDFGFLPSLPEPRVPNKFGPNHFMSDAHMNRPQSLPNLFSGGDPRLWMENDKCLKELSEAELWSLRSLRQPDCRVERILQAVATLTGQRAQRQLANPMARWGACREVLRSATFRTELLLFDANNVTAEAARMAHQLVDGLEAEDIRRINPGSAALLEWVRGVARWRINGPPSTGQSAWGLQALHPRKADLPDIVIPSVGAASAHLPAPPMRRHFAPGMNKFVSSLKRNPIHLIAAR